MWDAVYADRGIAQVSRATRARAIGVYFSVLKIPLHLWYICISLKIPISMLWHQREMAFLLILSNKLHVGIDDLNDAGLV